MKKKNEVRLSTSLIKEDHCDFDLNISNFGYQCCSLYERKRQRSVSIICFHSRSFVVILNLFIERKRTNIRTPNQYVSVYYRIKMRMGFQQSLRYTYIDIITMLRYNKIGRCRIP
ncbi:Chaperone protein HtpG [Dirofilaria immitis]